MKNMRNRIMLFMMSLVVCSPVGAELAPASSVASSTSTTACQEGSSTPCVKPGWELELDQAKSSWDVCQDDVDRFCEGVQVGEGRIEKCLKDHKSKLSKKCRKARGLK